MMQASKGAARAEPKHSNLQAPNKTCMNLKPAAGPRQNESVARRKRGKTMQASEARCRRRDKTHNLQSAVGAEKTCTHLKTAAGAETKLTHLQPPAGAGK